MYAIASRSPRRLPSTSNRNGRTHVLPIASDPDNARRAIGVARACGLALLGALALGAATAARAQGGPPFLTNDPGTPGQANWEINLGAMQTITRGYDSYQVPQIDLNFGVGDRIQLTYEVPYVVQNSGGESGHATGWSNGYPGLKWRFLDQGDDGWQMSVFPQVQMAAGRLARASGIAAPGPRYLLPVEVTHKVGPLDVDFEAGYYFPGNGPKERIFGLVVGRPVTERLELDVELYDDRAYGALPHATTLDVGGRYKLRTGLIGLFMAGRSLNGFGSAQPQFQAYVGIQILLSDYGRTITPDKAEKTGESPSKDDASRLEP